MKVKELIPILKHLDGDLEVEFTIVSQQEAPKNQETHKNEFRDNYRTCGSYTFGHAKFITDPEGLNVECWPIYNSVGLLGYLRKTNIISICDQNQQNVLSIGNEFLVMMISSSKQSLILFAQSMTATGKSFRLYSLQKMTGTSLWMTIQNSMMKKKRRIIGILITTKVLFHLFILQSKKIGKLPFSYFHSFHSFIH